MINAGNLMFKLTNNGTLMGASYVLIGLGPWMMSLAPCGLYRILMNRLSVKAGDIYKR